MSALSEKQQEAIALLVAGTPVAQVALAVNVHRQTLWRWRSKDLAFRRAVEEATGSIVQGAKDRIRALTDKSVERLGELLDSKDENIRLQAVRIVLDRGGVHPEAPSSELDPEEARSRFASSLGVGTAKVIPIAGDAAE